MVDRHGGGHFRRHLRRHLHSDRGRGVAVIYSLFVTMVVHREVNFADLWRIVQSSVYLISQILMIVTAAGLYSWLLTTSGIPQNIVAEINALQMPAWALLLAINVVLLIMVASWSRPRRS